MKKTLFVLALSLSAGSMLSGCGAAATVAAAVPTVLEGTWVYSDCTTAKQKTTWVFVASAFTRTQISYTDSACATKSSTSVQTGTISIGSAVTTPASSTAINFTTTTLGLTPTAGTAALYNTYCSGGTIGTLTDDVTTSFLGKRCGAASNPTEPAAGSIGYNIFKLVTTTTPNTFTLGGSYASATVSVNLLGAATAATIPTSLDSTSVFTKQ